MSILFTSNPLVGHWLPMLPLARAAQRAGHEVAVAAGPDAVAEVERRGFTAWSVGWDFQTVWAGMLTRPRRSRNCYRQAMLRLPAVPPLTGWRHSTRLPRDHYLRLDGNDYSVHPAAIGRRVELHASLDRVQVFYDGRLVADHPPVWARHQTITDPGHRQAADQLRRDRLTVLPAPDQQQVEQRRLDDYDLAFGLIDDQSGRVVAS